MQFVFSASMLNLYSSLQFENAIFCPMSWPEPSHKHFYFIFFKQQMHFYFFISNNILPHLRDVDFFFGDKLAKVAQT